MILVHVFCFLAFVDSETSELDRMLDERVPAYLTEKKAAGAVIGIVRGDKLMLRRAYGFRDVEANKPMTTETLFQIGSITKPMTATVIAKLVEQELLEWNDPVVDFFGEEVLFPSGWEDVTVEHLLLHTGGLPSNPINRRNLPDGPGVMLPYSKNELHEGLSRTELQSDPGTTWSYSNLGYGILGAIIEQVTGKSYENVLQEELFKPLGMSSSGIYPTGGQEKQLACHYWKNQEGFKACPGGSSARSVRSEGSSRVSMT